MKIRNLNDGLWVKRFSALAAACGLLGGVSAQAATVDLLVLYDNYTKTYFSGDVQTAMNNWVSQMNTAYRDSQVDIQLRLVGVRANEEVGADMNAVLNNLTNNTAVKTLRDQLGADFVSQLHQTGACGLGWVSISKNYTFNVVGPNCGPLTMAHELGHNMGLNHSRLQGNTGGSRYAYGLGYGVDSQFSTIMAYSGLFHTSRINRFSNPTILCKGLPCGVPIDRADSAYAALALSNVKDEIAGFRATATGASSASSVPASSKSSSSVVSSAKSSSSSVKSSASSVKSSIASSQASSASSVSSVASLNVTIQAENYVASYGIDTENTTDTGGGLNVGWIDAGDWLAYNAITIPVAGTYTVELRVASLNGGGKVSLDLDAGKIILGEIDIPKTSGWQNWVTVTKQVQLPAGTYKPGMFSIAGGWNINWFRINQ